MGLFDDIGSAFENLGSAKDEIVDQAGQQIEEIAPDIQNPIEGAQDAVQSFGENLLPGQGEDESQ